MPGAHCSTPRSSVLTHSHALMTACKALPVGVINEQIWVLSGPPKLAGPCRAILGPSSNASADTKFKALACISRHWATIAIHRQALLNFPEGKSSSYI